MKSQITSIPSAYEIEKMLSTKLRPVLPRKEFIEKLQTRLVDKPSVFLEKSLFPGAWLLVFSGFVIGIVIYFFSKGIRS